MKLKALVVAGVAVAATTIPAASAGTPDQAVRAAGGDRYDTNSLLVQAGVQTGVFPMNAGAFLASGTSFADALGAGPLAAQVLAPIILTPQDHIAPGTASALDALQPTTLIVVGGPGVISDQAVSEALTHMPNAAASPQPFVRVQSPQDLAGALTVLKAHRG